MATFARRKLASRSRNNHQPTITTIIGIGKLSRGRKGSMLGDATSMIQAAYRINTPRLVMRVWRLEDAAELKRAQDESREHVAAFIFAANKPPQTVDETLAKLRAWRADAEQGEHFRYGVFDCTSGAIVGGAGLHPWTSPGGYQIGYWLHPAWTKKGLATEMAGTLTRVAFEISMLRFVEIRCAKSNTASARVPMRLGFIHEATLRQRLELPGDVYDDALVFSMLAREYPSSAAKKIDIHPFDAADHPLSLKA